MMPIPVHYHAGGFPPTELNWSHLVTLIGHAWKWLRRALFDLTELTDPELEDREAHHWGCRLADKVKEEIEQ